MIRKSAEASEKASIYFHRKRFFAINHHWWSAHEIGETNVKENDSSYWDGKSIKDFYKNIIDIEYAEAS